jgi:hypothetical protein
MVGQAADTLAGSQDPNYLIPRAFNTLGKTGLEPPMLDVAAGPTTPRGALPQAPWSSPHPPVVTPPPHVEGEVVPEYPPSRRLTTDLRRSVSGPRTVSGPSQYGIALPAQNVPPIPPPQVRPALPPAPPPAGEPVAPYRVLEPSTVHARVEPAGAKLEPNPQPWSATEAKAPAVAQARRTLNQLDVPYRVLTPKQADTINTVTKGPRWKGWTTEEKRTYLQSLLAGPQPPPK